MEKTEITIITYADLGKFRNLKTQDILSLVKFFKEKKLLAKVVCRLGQEEGVDCQNAVPLFLHFFVAGLGKIFKFFPSRKIEEWIFDFFANRMEIPKGIVVFHPAKFPKTIKKARKQGNICIGIAVNSSRENTKKLIKEELNKQRILNFKVDKLLEKDQINQIDYLIALSNFSKKTYIESGFPEEKIFTANLDINTDRFYPEEKVSEKFTVLFPVSMIGILKGLQYVLDAWQDFDVPDKRLIILGKRYKWPRKMEEKYKKIIKGDSSILELDIVKNPEFYMRKSDVVVFPSFTEGFSRSVAESMACEVPIILTENSTDTEKFFIDGKHGKIIPVGDSKAISSALFYFYNNREKGKEMGRKAREQLIDKKPFQEEVFEICQKITRIN